MTIDATALVRITEDDDPMLIDPLTYDVTIHFDGEDIESGTWAGYLKDELTDPAPLDVTITVDATYDDEAVDENGDAITGGSTAVAASFDGDELQGLIGDDETEWNGWLEVSRPDAPVKGYIAEVRVRRNVNWTAA